MGPPSGTGRLVATDWYAAMLGGLDRGFDSASDRIARRGRFQRALGARLSVARGLLLARATADAPVVAIKRAEPGTTTFLVAEALRRRRRTVLLEFIGRPTYQAGWKRFLDAAWVRLVEGPALRTALLAGQVLTKREAGTYAKRYRLDPDRLRHVPWALSRTAERDNPPLDERAGVVSSGRAFCDWETLLAAQRGRDWPLTIVCDRASAARLAAHADDASVRVLSEIPRSDHDALVERAAAYAVCLDDPGVSAGQVRLMTAVELGTPVVATHGAALDGYVSDGATAVVVPAGDPGALRGAIESLLADPERRLRLAETALRRASSRTYADYFEDVRRLVTEAAAQVSAGGTSSRSE